MFNWNCFFSVIDLGAGEEKVSKKETKTFVGNTATSTAKTELNTVSHWTMSFKYQPHW